MTAVQARTHLSIVASAPPQNPDSITEYAPCVGDHVVYIGVCRRTAIGETPEQIVAVIDVMQDQMVSKIVGRTIQKVKTGNLIITRRFADHDHIVNHLTSNASPDDKVIYSVALRAIEIAKGRNLDVGPAQAIAENAITYDPFEETPQAHIQVASAFAL